MKISRLLPITPDTEYEVQMLKDHVEYYQKFGADFTFTYRAENRKLIWKEPTTPRNVFFDIFDKLSCNSEWVFLDCGCGLGHAMYLASFFFNVIYGIEIITEIAQICEKNLQLTMPFDKKYEVLNCDLLKPNFSVLNKTNVFYVSSPFIGEKFDNFMQIIKESIITNEREVWIVYFYAYCEDIMKKYSDILPLEMSFLSIGKVNYYHHQLI
jgi:hypothetical protein